MKKVLTVAASCAALLVIPASAEARSCGTYDTAADGTRITLDAYDGATCTFARATADRFYAVDGVPRHLWVFGTRLAFRSHRAGADWEYWFYTGVRYGRPAAIFISQESPNGAAQYDAPPSYTPPSYTPPSYAPPSVPSTGAGYPVVCADGWLSHSGGIQGACSHHGGIG